MKAWYVTDKNGYADYAIIVFAETKGKAVSLALGTEEFPKYDWDFTELRATREPKLDGAYRGAWRMEWDNDDYEYEDGKIMDPKSGKVYSSVIWKDKKNPSVLNVRGKIGPFGRTQNWNVLTVSELPADLQDLDVSGWMPKVIKK